MTVKAVSKIAVVVGEDPFLILTFDRDGHPKDADVYTMLDGTFGNRTLLQLDLNTGKQSVLKYRGHSVVEESTVSPNVVEPTCYICTETETIPGHEDSGCLTLALAACGVLGGNLPARAACVAAAYAACYVPAQTICTEWVVSHICPTP